MKKWLYRIFYLTLSLTILYSISWVGFASLLKFQTEKNLANASKLHAVDIDYQGITLTGFPFNIGIKLKSPTLITNYNKPEDRYYFSTPWLIFQINPLFNKIKLFHANELQVAPLPIETQKTPEPKSITRTVHQGEQGITLELAFKRPFFLLYNKGFQDIYTNIASFSVYEGPYTTYDAEEAILSTGQEIRFLLTKVLLPHSDTERTNQLHLHLKITDLMIDPILTELSSHPALGKINHETKGMIEFDMNIKKGTKKPKVSFSKVSIKLEKSQLELPSTSITLKGTLDTVKGHSLPIGKLEVTLLKPEPFFILLEQLKIIPRDSVNAAITTLQPLAKIDPSTPQWQFSIGRADVNQEFMIGNANLMDVYRYFRDAIPTQ